jgi:acyl dehydratase
MKILPIEEIQNMIGQQIGVSDWFEIDQNRINQFADATNDQQFIHVDPEAAKSTPWGTTIAHGFLTLSLLSYMSSEAGLAPENFAMAINYGLDKVRFIEPVPVNSRIRSNSTLVDVQDKKGGRWLLKSSVTIEIENVKKPAAIVEALTMFVIPEES